MHKIAYFATAMISTLSLFACSQTVEAPSQDEEDATAYSSSSSKNKKQDSSSKDNQTKKSSSSTSSDWDDEDDNGGFVIDTAKITRSPIEFTGDKKDCDFSVDDSIWTIEQVDSNSTSISYISFDENAMKVKMEVNAKLDSGYTCDETLAIWAFMMALSDGKDIDGSCTDDGLIAMGTLVDSTRTIKDKEEVYKEICN